MNDANNSLSPGYASLSGADMTHNSGADAAAAAAATVKSIKLPSTIPVTGPNERPYYYEGFYRHCLTTMKEKEASVVTSEFAAACAEFFRESELHPSRVLGEKSILLEGAAPLGSAFAWNEKFQSAMMMSDATTIATTDTTTDDSGPNRGALQKAVNRFAESAIPLCESAVFASHRLFQNCEVPESQQQQQQQHGASSLVIPFQTSFLAPNHGALIHVWRSNTEAKHWVRAQRTVAQAVQDLKLSCIATPVTVLVVVHTLTVSITALVPVRQSSTPTDVDPNSVLATQRKVLVALTRSRNAFPFFEGADGRWYIMDSSGVLRQEGESQGEPSCFARPSLVQSELGVEDFPEALQRAGRRQVETVAKELIAAITALGSGGGEGASLATLKVHDLMHAKLVPRTLHRCSFKMSYLYDLAEHPSIKQAPAASAGAVARDLIYAEMICRTMKEIARSEIATNSHISVPTDAATGAVVQLFVEMVNRAAFQLLTKEDLWAAHVMPVLRVKFATPATFTIGRSVVTKKSVLNYIGNCLGLVFEGGRYVRTMPLTKDMGNSCCVSSSSLVGSPQSQDSEKVAKMTDILWQKALVVTQGDIQLAAMRACIVAHARRGEVSLFVERLTQFETKMDERGVDIFTKTDTTGFLLSTFESLLTLLQAKGNDGEKVTGRDALITLARQAFVEFTKKLCKTMTLACDCGVASERMLSASRLTWLLQPIEPGKSAEDYPETMEEATATAHRAFQYLRTLLPRNDSSTEDATADLKSTTTNAAATAAAAVLGHRGSPLPQIVGLVLSDTHFALGCEMMLSLFNTDGRGESDLGEASEILALLQLAKTTRQRYLLLGRCLTQCAKAALVAGVQVLAPSKPPPPPTAAASVSDLSTSPTKPNLDADSVTPNKEGGDLHHNSSSNNDDEESPSDNNTPTKLASNLSPQRAYSRRATIAAEIAFENLRVYSAVGTELELPYYHALLLYTADWGLDLLSKQCLNLRQMSAVVSLCRSLLRAQVGGGGGGGTERTATKAAASELADQTAKLRQEAILRPLGAIVEVFMDQHEWAMVKRLLAFTHHVMSDGKVDGYSRLGQPAHSCLQEVARLMAVALSATKKLQTYALQAIANKELNRQRALEARALREAKGLSPAALRDQPLPWNFVADIAKECYDYGLKSDAMIKICPPARGLAEVTSTTLVGLRTLLSVTPGTRQNGLCSNLSCVAMQSGYFPPLKYVIHAHSYGHRHVLILPETNAHGRFWSDLWMMPSKFYEASVPLYAKIASQFLFSQIRVSGLYFTMVGFGWAGPVAQCLACLSPPADTLACVTFGSPAALSVAKGAPTPTAAHAHYLLDVDLVPHLIGCATVPHARAAIMGVLEGSGCLCPTPPTKKQLFSTSLYQYYGGQNITVLAAAPKEGGAPATATVLPQSVVGSSAALDLRTQFCWVTPRHYLDAVLAVWRASLPKDSGVLVPSSPTTDARGNKLHSLYAPPENPFLAQGVLPDGTPTEYLKSNLKVPPCVEPNVASPNLMLLTYPKLTSRILKGLLPLDEDYGFDPKAASGVQQAIDALLRCKTNDQLVSLLRSYVGASWHAEELATQLLDWSGALAAGGLQRQPLSVLVVETFVQKHAFLFTICPETTRSQEGGSLLDRLSRHLSEDGKLRFAQPDGYHVGASVVIASTLPGTDLLRTVLDAIHNASCTTNGIADVHPRTRTPGLHVPAVRFAWTPPSRAVVHATRHSSNSSSNNNNQQATSGIKLFVQWNLRELTFDGGANVSQIILRNCALCLWVVYDDYSFVHLTRTVDLSDASPELRSLVVLCAPPLTDPGPSATQQSAAHHLHHPQQQHNGRIDAQLSTKVKTHCESIGIPFVELVPDEADSATQLFAQMMKEFTQMVRVPVTPLNIARTVTLGCLYAHDEDEIVRFTKKGAVNFIKPASPPATGRGGGGEDGDPSRAAGGAKGGKQSLTHAAATASVLSGRGIAFQGASDQPHQPGKVKRSK